MKYIIVSHPKKWKLSVSGMTRSKQFKTSTALINWVERHFRVPRLKDKIAIKVKEGKETVNMGWPTNYAPTLIYTLTALLEDSVSEDFLKRHERIYERLYPED